MKKALKNTFITIFILFMACNSKAQTTEEKIFKEYLKQEQQNFQKYLNSESKAYKQYIREEQEKFEKYKKQKQNEFQQYKNDSREAFDIYISLKSVSNTLKVKVDKAEAEYPKELDIIPIKELELDIELANKELVKIESDTAFLEEEVAFVEKIEPEEITIPEPTSDKEEIRIELDANRPIYYPLPQSTFRISSNFSHSRFHPILEEHRPHYGIDLAAPAGTNVFATAKGTVRLSKNSGATGQYVIVDHENEYSTTYMHLKNRNVKVGDKVNAGDIIGSVGSTGFLSTGNHLHYEIRKNGNALNPKDFLIKYY